MITKDTFRDLEMEIESLKYTLKDKEDFINKYATAYARQKGYVAEAEVKVKVIKEKLSMLEAAYVLLVKASDLEECKY